MTNFVENKFMPEKMKIWQIVKQQEQQQENAKMVEARAAWARA